MSRLIIVGGFLGAGKTTLLLQAAHMLIERGYRVGLITNDQGQNLVDTQLAAQRDIPVTEVAGGCFCCRFPDLIKALRHLQKTVGPDVILAEPVGSCTDLIATILNPLAHYYPDQFQISPLTILLDAQRDLIDFSPDVTYLYRQQLAEADLLVLNKIERLSPAQVEHQQAELQLLAPAAGLMSLSARSGVGLPAWLERVLHSTHAQRPPLNLDYGRYARAEAELGWLNAHGVLLTSSPVPVTDWATDLLAQLAASWQEQTAPIAHVKLILQTDSGRMKVSLTQRGGPLLWDNAAAAAPATQIEFILNARVGSPPDRLSQTVHQALDAVKPHPESRYEFAHFECFSPLPPRPTHHLASQS